MKSETLYNRLICIDALLSFDAIIPSLPELQLTLISLIDRLGKALVAEGECERLSDELCHAFCSYLDRQIALRLRADKMAWARYSLTHYYYGYADTSDSSCRRLERLLVDSRGHIFTYAQKLFAVATFAGPPRASLLALPAPQSGACHTENAAAAPRVIPTPSPNRFMLPLQLLLLSLLLAALWLGCSGYLETL